MAERIVDEELDAKKQAVAAPAGAVRSGRVRLLVGARDTVHNNALALRAYLSERLEAV